MRIACLGGGPAGLYFAIAMKLRDPAHDITVVERNRPYDTFGWGVVLSDETLANLEAADPVSAEEIRRAFVYWDDIAVHYRGTVMRSSGHGFSGVGRKRLLNILQDRAKALGVKLQFETEFDSLEPYRDYDLIVAADGANSRVRTALADVFKPDIDVRACKYIWLGTHKKFDDAFTFIFEETEHGWILGARLSVRCRDGDVHRRVLRSDLAPVRLRRMSQDETIATCERIFARYLDGNRLMTNARHLRGSAWLNFPRVLCETWSHENIVLMGDAAATAHFSVGSGTKLALESAIALAGYLHSEPTLQAAFQRYEDERRTEVLKLQSAARNSTEWFEDVERYLHLDPVQFNYSLLTRSQRISHENLRQRDKAWLDGAEMWFEQQSTGDKPNAARPPMFTPFRLREMHLKNRIVVSPMAQYRAVDGTPTDWHLVHYAERAKGGAGLVTTEMTCVSPEGRITPGCTGLYAPEHEAAWKRIVDFVHAETDAKIAMQLGHSGAKGSTQLGWEDMDAPLAQRQLGDHGAVSRAVVAAQPGAARDDARRHGHRCATSSCVRPRWRSAPASTCWSCISPTAISCRPSSRRSPTAGRTPMAARSRTACAFRWRFFTRCGRCGLSRNRSPCASRPTIGSARTASRRRTSVEIARLLKQAGVDIIDVSAGQTSIAARPVYGRMFQTPFSDRIRNEVGIATMAVGNITEPDHVNSILMAGRADLCCLARPHLADPYWTLHAAARQGYRGETWPKPYLAGRDQLHRLAERAETATEKV